MARDGLGNFNLSEPPFVYDTTILEDAMNNVLSDIASGLTQSLSKDGQTLPTAPLPMGGYRHTGVGNASARNQYAAAGQAQDGAFTWCGTAAGGADALTLSPSPAIAAYVAGQEFRFMASASNTGAATVAVSGLTATAIQNAGAALVSGDIVAGRVYSIVYNGSAFQIAAHSLGLSGAALPIASGGTGATTASAARDNLGVATRWESRAVGEPFGLWDHLTGAETPPTAEGGPRFIKLTAADAYNTGLLSSETVTGTAPDITATAVIALEGSPLNGQTVHLVNTERRFPRAGESGTIQGDAIRDLQFSVSQLATSNSPNTPVVTGAATIVNGAYSGGWQAGSFLGLSALTVKASNTLPTATENRSRNIGETYYMRIK